MIFDRFVAASLTLLLLATGCQSTVEKENESPSLPLQKFSGIKKGEAACRLSTGGVYKVRQPKDWVLDGEAGKAQNFCLVAYPSGASWEDSLSVIYLNQKPQKSKPFVEWVREDIEKFKKETPLLKVGEPPILSGARPKYPVEVKTFITKSPPSFEKVAYINPPGHVVVIVLNSKSKEEFEASQTAFDQLIGSFEYFQ